MLKHHLKIAWRNLLRNKGYSAINIGGLALGMAVVIIIGLWVLDEFSFNNYHKDHNRIAQVYNRVISPDSGEIEVGNASLYLTSDLLKEKYGQYFEQVLRAWWVEDFTLNLPETTFTRTGEFIESGALELFSLEMVHGNYSSLESPDAIVLSETTAKAIFGEGNPVGKDLKINNQMNATVKGVYRDLPKNTQFENVKFFANWELYETANPWIQQVIDVWDDHSFNVYVKLRPEVDLATVNAAIEGFYMDNSPKEMASLYQSYRPKLLLHPMDKWHLYSEFEQGKATGGRITFVWLFMGIGLFVLVLASINFMNLSTARSERRAKEVGVRKTVGSGKRHLIHQFLGESLLVSGMALLLALLMVLLFLPWFNELSGKAMEIPWARPLFWLSLVLFSVFTGLLAGSYPALYLSSFNPLMVLKGTFKAGPDAAVPRKVLVVFQFMVSIVLAIGTLVVFNQIQFTKDRPMGYDQANLIMVKLNDPSYNGKYNLLRERLKNTGAISEMAQSSAPMTNVVSNWGFFDWPGKDPDRQTDFAAFHVTHDFGKTVGWQFLEGRDFSRELASDSLSVVINEAAVKYMGLDNAVGQYITHKDGPPLKIIGITKDMVVQSPYQPVKQAIFFLGYGDVKWMDIRLKADVAPSLAIDRVEEVVKGMVPSANFEYTFVDRLYADKFASEQRLGNLAGVFTILAIFISCLGLFGLASFIVEQRRKEIGVRKVLGATVADLWQLLSQDFVLLVLLSCLLALPLAYYGMERWLESYEYRISVSWWILGSAMIGALAITLLTVSFQAIRAASTNPIKSLRTE